MGFELCILNLFKTSSSMSLVRDRESFWMMLWRRFETFLKYNMIAHSQTDGQTKVVIIVRESDSQHLWR